ncbi:MAG: Transporter [Candidatus Saccharibacteria bacterium GW2011_GWC2_48_9]|nr:MAG: Transporter [Candidatus Saccharibacteria bacterium GW2011_GWC2_48_9]HCH35019.1 putative cation transport regulator ChaB [Candidatus Saccharibacteria bacterium]
MPFNSISELPDNVKNVLPAHAQDIYKEAFNSAYDEYKDPEDRRGDTSREEVAHRVAWSAVKQKYHKSDDDTWHRNNS